MTFTREVTTTLRTIANGSTGLNRGRSKAGEIAQLIEAYDLPITDEFKDAVTAAQRVFANIGQVRQAATEDLVEVALDPKKLKAHLEHRARNDRLDIKLVSSIYTQLNSQLMAAAVRNAGVAMDAFIERYKDSGLYAELGGTPGQRLLAQEKRDGLNETHRQLLRAIEGWAPDDLKYIGYWFRWTYTPEQWKRIEDMHTTSSSLPAVDQLALEVGATHRFARSWDHANTDYDACLDQIEEQNREERSNAINGLTLSNKWIPVRTG